MTTTLDVADALIVIDEGGANEVKLRPNDAALSLLEAQIVLTTGSHAQKLSVKALDRSRAWKKIAFGRSVKVYLNGTVVFAGTVTMPRRDVLGTAVLLDFDAVGKTYMLYTKRITADTTYKNQTTGTTAKAVVDAHFGGVLTTTNMTTATGVTVAEFVVSVGENVGQVLERLSKLDGYSFFVDTSNDVHYYVTSSTSQATITEEDLIGEPGEHFVEDGILPPRNIVRIVGGSGFNSWTTQEERDSYFNLDATSDYVAQRFKATTGRLSAFEFFVNYTIGANKPGAAQVGVYKNGYDEAPSGTLTVTFNGGGSITNQANAVDQNDATFANTSGMADGGSVYFSFDFGASKTIRGWRARYLWGGGSSQLTPKLYYSDDGSTWTLYDTGSVSVTQSVITTQTRMVTERAHRYWRVELATVSGAPTIEIYSINILSSATSGANQSYPCYDSAGTHLIQWSDDHTIQATDLPNPAGWHNRKVWTRHATDDAQSKLLLTANDFYWILVKASSDASDTKYWQMGYEVGSTTHTDGFSVSSTDSGTTWTTLGLDLTFKLYWSADTIDHTDTNPTSISAHGEWYHEEVLPEITTQADAEAVADAILRDYADPATRMTLPLKKVMPSLTPKQKITVVRPLLDMNTTATLVEIRHEIRRDGARTVLITGALPYNSARAVEELRKVS